MSIDEKLLTVATEELDSDIYRAESVLLGLERGEIKKKQAKKSINDGSDEGNCFSVDDPEIKSLLGYDKEPSFENGIGYIEMAHLSSYKELCYKAGYRLLLQGALKTKCPKCFLGIAHCLMSGIGTDTNLSLAEELFKENAEKAKALGDGGDYEADIALYYATIKETHLFFTPLESAIVPTYDNLTILKRGEDAGNPHTQYILGKDRGGLGAIESLEDASRGGYALASYTLGTIYHRGYTQQADWVWIAYPKIDTKPSGASIPRIPDESNHLVKRLMSYSKGEQYHRGLCHNGNSATAKVDRDRAREYYLLAIEQGMTFGAQSRINELDQLNNGFEIYDGALIRYHQRSYMSKTVRVPDGVDLICPHAFKGCKLKKLIFPRSVTYIYDDAFGSNFMYSKSVRLPRIVGSSVNIKEYKRLVMGERRKSKSRAILDEVFGYNAPITYFLIGLIVCALSLIPSLALKLFYIYLPQVSSLFVYGAVLVMGIAMCVVQRIKNSGYPTVMQNVFCFLPALATLLILYGGYIPGLPEAIISFAMIILAFLSFAVSASDFPLDILKSLRLWTLVGTFALIASFGVACTNGALTPTPAPTAIMAIYIACAASPLIATVFRLIKEKKRTFRYWWNDRSWWQNIAFVPLTVGFTLLAIFSGAMAEHWLVICCFISPVATFAFCIFMFCDFPLDILSRKPYVISISLLAVSLAVLFYLAALYGFHITRKPWEIVALIGYIGASLGIGIYNIKRLEETSSGINATGIYLSTISLIASLFTFFMYDLLTLTGVIILAVVAVSVLAIMVIYKTNKKS